MSREFDELLSAYLDGEVSPEECAAVERRLEQSPQLRETLDELSEVGDLIRRLPRARAPIDLPERVVAAISPKPLASTTQPRKRHRLFGTWPLFATGTVLALGVTIVVLMPLGKKNAENDLALRSPQSGGEPASAAGSSILAFDADHDRGITPLSTERGGAWSDNLATTRSLTEYVRNLGRKPLEGEVIRTLQDNAGDTQVLVFNVVDTREIGGKLRTIFANNSLNIVETETPVPTGGLAGASKTTDRFVYYLEGPPEQLEQALGQIHSLPVVVGDAVDYGVLGAEPEAARTEFFADLEEKPTSAGVPLQKDKADLPAPTPSYEFRFGTAAPARAVVPKPAPQAVSDLSVPALVPADPAAPAAPATNGSEDLKRAKKEVLLGDQVEFKTGEAAKGLEPAPARTQAGASRGEVERLSATPSPQLTNNYLGVSAQLNSNSPMVENVLRARIVGNSIQGNAVQGNAVQGNAPLGNATLNNSPQRGSVGQSQRYFNRDRQLRLSEEQLGRKFNEAVPAEQQEKLNEAKLHQLKQQNTAGRAAADGTRELDAFAVTNPQNAVTPEEGLVKVLLILEPQPPQPAAAAPAAPPAKPEAK